MFSLMLFIVMNRSIPHHYQHVLRRRSFRNDGSQLLIMGIVEPNIDRTPYQLLITILILSLETMNVRSYQT